MDEVGGLERCWRTQEDDEWWRMIMNDVRWSYGTNDSDEDDDEDGDAQDTAAASEHATTTNDCWWSWWCMKELKY